MRDNLTKIGTIRKLYLNQIMQHIVMSVSFETVNTATVLSKTGVGNHI